MYKKFLLYVFHILIFLSIVCWTHIPKQKYKQYYAASYYSDFFVGKKTSLGQVFSNNGFTIATSDKKFLGKHITFFYSKTNRKVKVFCNDLMNIRMKNKIHFDLSKHIMKYLSNEKIHYPGKIWIEISKVEN